MGNRYSKNLIAAVILAIIAAVLTAEDSTTVQDPDEITRQKLATIQAEIIALRKEAARLNERENSILAQLSQFELQFAIHTHEIELLETKQEQMERDIVALEKKYVGLNRDLARQKEYLTRRLVEAYKLGELNYLKLMMKVNQSSDLLRSYQYITYLAKDDSRKVQAYRASLVDLEQTRLRLEQEQRNLVQLKQSLQLARNSLNISREEKLRLLASIRGERTVHLTALTDLRAAANQLQQFFSTTRPSKMVPPAVDVPSISKLKGYLNWPVRGRITRHFGVYKHPRFKTTTMSNGIEISAPHGTEVHAVYEGEVVFSEWFKGYGQCIIIAHADGYYTLYAHNAELLVQRGENVQTAQPIAKVGSTGSLEANPSLYFEVRQRDQPLNPLHWLRKR